MKNLLAGIALLGMTAFATAQTITFDKTTFDYGVVKNGANGDRSFTVTNTGSQPLIISSVKASCGCTTPKFSKDPILPGKSAKIEVGYNTKINGAFNKMIEVYSNDPENSRSVIYIKGKVDPAEAAAVAAQEVKPAKSAALKSAKSAKVAAKKL